MRITLDGTPKWQAMTWFNQSENKDLKRLVFYTDAEANDKLTIIRAELAIDLWPLRAKGLIIIVLVSPN